MYLSADITCILALMKKNASDTVALADVKEDLKAQWRGAWKKASAYFAANIRKSRCEALGNYFSACSIERQLQRYHNAHRDTNGVSTGLVSSIVKGWISLVHWNTIILHAIRVKDVMIQWLWSSFLNIYESIIGNISASSPSTSFCILNADFSIYRGALRH